MENITVKIFCPRCGAEHEAELARGLSETIRDTFSAFDLTCEGCGAPFNVFTTDEPNAYLSVTSIDYSDNPYKFIKEDL